MSSEKVELANGWLGPILRGRRWLARHRDLKLALYGAVLFGLFYLISWKRLDPDFGWHLISGNYFRAHGIPAHDIFTYTARNFPWIDHEWGNDVIVSWLFGIGGYNLVAVLFAGLWAGAVWLVGRRARLWVVLLAALAAMPYAGIRPVSWTVFLLAVTLTILESPWCWLVWLLPPIFIVWSNLHAGFIAGLAIVAYYCLRRRFAPRLLLVLALCGLATLINAYGPRIYVEVARTLFDRELHNQIEEWESFSILPACWTFIILWGVGFAYFDARRWRRWLQLPVLLLLSALSASRNFPLFVIAALGPTDKYIERIRRAFPARLNKASRWIVAGFVILALLAIGYTGWRVYWPWQTRDAGYPVRAVAYLRENPCPGHLFNDYNYGGYLIWQLPGRPVFIDGRMPSWRAPDGRKYLDIYDHVLTHPTTNPQLFKRYDIRCVLLGKSDENQPLLQRLSREGWRDGPANNGSRLLLAPIR